MKRLATRLWGVLRAAGCSTHTLRDDGDIGGLNLCRKGSLDGEEKSALGRARVVERSTNEKLEVSFFRPFWGDDWILSRTPTDHTP